MRVLYEKAKLLKNEYCNHGFASSLMNNKIHLIFLLVHPCDKPARGGCEEFCNKDGENVVCTCGLGFVLARDGKSCDKSNHRFFVIQFSMFNMIILF